MSATLHLGKEALVNIYTVSLWVTYAGMKFTIATISLCVMFTGMKFISVSVYIMDYVVTTHNTFPGKFHENSFTKKSKRVVQNLLSPY